MAQLYFAHAAELAFDPVLELVSGTKHVVIFTPQTLSARP